MNSGFHQIIKYGVVAVIAQLLDITVLYTLTSFIGVHYLIAGVCGFSMSLILNYYLCKRWVFAYRGGITNTKALTFVGIALVGLALTTALLWLFTDVLGYYYLQSKLFAILIVFWWNFLARRQLIFNPESNTKKEIA
jgi:putative flippase GtrA